MKFYQFISKTEIKPAPAILTEIVGSGDERAKRHILSPTEADYNRLGYYRLAVDEYPTDGKYAYSAAYVKDGLTIRQTWERGEKLEPAEEKTEVQRAFDIVKQNAEKATTIKGLVSALVKSAEEINEGVDA